VGNPDGAKEECNVVDVREGERGRKREALPTWRPQAVGEKSWWSTGVEHRDAVFEGRREGRRAGGEEKILLTMQITKVMKTTSLAGKGKVLKPKVSA